MRDSHLSLHKMLKARFCSLIVYGTLCLTLAAASLQQVTTYWTQLNSHNSYRTSRLRACWHGGSSFKQVLLKVTVTMTLQDSPIVVAQRPAALHCCVLPCHSVKSSHITCTAMQSLQHLGELARHVS